MRVGEPMRRSSIYFATFVLLAASAFAQSYKLTQPIPLGGDGAWDYLKADVEARRLYVSHSGEVVVLDLDSRKRLGTLSGFGFIHGILVVEKLNTGFLTDGHKNEVVTFDPKTLTITGRLKTAANPNSMVYDETTGRIFVGHKPSKSMTVIDTATVKIVGNIQLGGIPEFPVSDGAGNIYINIDDTSEIVQVDSATLKVKAHWPLTPCKSPSGLAIDTKAHRLFAACDNKLLAVVNADTGRLVSTLPIGDEPDAAAFDPGTGTIFSSNGDGTLTIIKSIGNDRYKVVQNLTTEKGARTMAFDSKTGAVYLSTAKLGPPPAPTPQNPNPPRHPTAIAGSFKVLVAVSQEARSSR
jgi:hypothetical protein